MIGLLFALIVPAWVFGRTTGMLGGLAGGLVGALVLIGMASTTSNGELAGLYSPQQLASTAIPLAVVAAVLALASPHAIGFAALGWAVGALLAAMAAPRTEQAVYILPLAVHILAAGVVVRLAKWRAATLSR